MKKDIKLLYSWFFEEKAWTYLTGSFSMERIRQYEDRIILLTCEPWFYENEKKRRKYRYAAIAVIKFEKKKR